MKKYTIHYNYYATIDVEVLAENEEEAKLKADLVEVDANDYDFSLNEQSVVNVEDGVDLENMTRKLVVRVKQYAVDHAGEPLPLRHLHLLCDVNSVWNGSDYEVERDQAADVTWNESEQSLVVSFDHTEPMNLDELRDIDQYYMAKSVLES